MGKFHIAQHSLNQSIVNRQWVILVNEPFLALQERHPEYLIERFGFSTE